MSHKKNPAAVALGKMTSPAKADAARENGKMGGRPRELVDVGNYDRQSICRERGGHTWEHRPAYCVVCGADRPKPI